MDIAEATNEQLIEELAKRESEAIEASKPKMIANPDWSEVRARCKAYIDCVAGAPCPLGYDFNIAICEVALEALFGKDVLDWIWIHEGEKVGARCL